MSTIIAIRRMQVSSDVLWRCFPTKETPLLKCEDSDKPYVVGTGEFGNGETLAKIENDQGVSKEQILQASHLPASLVNSTQPVRRYTRL